MATPSAILWLIVGLILAPALTLTRADPDLWGHVRFGLRTLTTYTLPASDIFSFTQDVPWINHEWLSELLMGAAYRTAGTFGLALQKGALVAALLLIVLGAYRRAAPGVAAAIVVTLAAGIGRQAMTLRPQLWSLVGVGVLCRLFVSGPRRWWLVGLPVVFGLWANLHGGWIVGAGLLAVWSAFQMVRPQASRRLVVAVGILSALATLANPYGLMMWSFLAGTVRMSREIAEWQPLTAVPVLARIPWAAVVVGILVVVASGGRPRIDGVAMTALLAYGAFRVERLSPLMVVAAIVLMSPTIVARWNNGSGGFNPLSRTAAKGLAIAIALLAVIAGVGVAKTASCISMAGPWIPDRLAGRALAATTGAGRVVTFFDWGQYAIWHLGPRLRVSIDGRRETVYSDRVLEGHEAMNQATPEGLEYLRQLDPDYVWLPARFARLREWLTGHGYRIDLQTDRSFIAVRAGLPVLDVPSSGPLPRCFPGP